MKKIGIFFFVLCFWGILSAQEAKITPFSGALQLDGKLDDPAWRLAPEYGSFQFLKVREKSGVTPAATTFKVLADSENLYVGIRCAEPKMNSLRVSAKENSVNIWGDDMAEIFLAPCGHKEKYYQFAVTASGVLFPMYYEEAGNVKPDDPYGAIFQARTFHGEDYWSAEVKIPLCTFYMTPKSEWRGTWLFNVTRTRIPVWESTSWSPLQSKYHEPASFRKISGAPSKPDEQDLRIRGVKALLLSREADGSFKGTLTADILLFPASRTGLCTLEISSENLKKTVSVQASLTRGSNKIVIPDVEIRNEGKSPAVLRLKDPENKVVAERKYPVTNRYEPLKFRFDLPAYSRCFFPGQDATHLKGAVLALFKEGKIELSVGTKKYPLAVQNGVAVFDVDISKEEGEIKLQAKIDNIVAENSIRKLKDTGRKMVWIEPPRRLVINGKRAFGFGWYGGSGYLAGKAYLEKYPTPAAKHPYNFGGQVTVMPGWLIKSFGDGGESNQDVYPSEPMLRKLKEVIEKNSASDFDYYYLSDEPEFHGVSAVYLKHMYDCIKQLDPYHPVMIITTRPEEFMECADILNPHIYIKPMVDDDGKRTLGSPVSLIRDAARRVVETGRPDKLVFGTPQTFNYRFVNSYAVFPTFDETNAWIWSLICNEGQGLTPFIYFDHASRPDLDFGIDFIYNSIRRLEPYITSSEPVSELKVSNPQVDAKLISGKGHLMLITVNLSPEEQTVKLESSALNPFKTLHAFREGFEQDVKDGEISFKLHPYQVHILTSVKEDDGLFSLQTLRGRIAEAEKERCSSESILFEKGKRIEINTSPGVFTDTLVKEDKFFDGVKNIYAWSPDRGKSLPIFIELGFRRFAAKFSRLRVYGHQLDGLEFSILKYGKWIPLKPRQIKKEKYMLEYDFGETCSTVKISFRWPKENRDLEIYELELLK